MSPRWQARDLTATNARLFAAGIWASWKKNSKAGSGLLVELCAAPASVRSTKAGPVHDAMSPIAGD